ncbi:MAG: ECF transporter S component [Bacilli bacterium]|nr:ECF transporter S component [Bacilli bacterium]
MITNQAWFKWTMAGVLLLIAVGLFIFSFLSYKKKNLSPVKFVAVTGIFGALAAILYCVPIFTFNLPFLPAFLSIHLDEIPIFLVGYLYGPLPSIMVTLIKTLIKLPNTSTACVGEFGDFIFTCVFVLPSVILYERRRKFSSVFIGFGISLTLHLLVTMIANVYVMIPFYSSFYNMSYETLLKACQAANKNIKDVGWSYALLAVLPMNAIKDSIVIVAVLVLYKRLHILIDRIGTQKHGPKDEPEVIEEQK